VIERGASGTTITFPSGHSVKLPPDAEPQIIHDPKVKRRKTPKKVELPAPIQPESQPPDDSSPPPGADG
jgi:hypothetical protein